MTFKDDVLEVGKLDLYLKDLEQSIFLIMKEMDDQGLIKLKSDFKLVMNYISVNYTSREENEVLNNEMVH